MKQAGKPTVYYSAEQAGRNHIGSYEMTPEERLAVIEANRQRGTLHLLRENTRGHRDGETQGHHGSVALTNRTRSGKRSLDA